MRLTPLLLLDLGSIKERRDDCRRADAHGYAGFHQLGSPLLVRLVEIVVAVAHRFFSMAFPTPLEAG